MCIHYKIIFVLSFSPIFCIVCKYLICIAVLESNRMAASFINSAATTFAYAISIFA